MIDLTTVCQYIDSTPVGDTMANSSWLFPSIETVHLSTMAVLVGSISAFDLRLLGLILKREKVSDLAQRLIPVTWISFAVMVLTGGLLFAADAAHKYCPNLAFRAKLILIALAGLNMMIFHFTIYTNVQKWDTSASPPFWAKTVGTVSVVLWVGVVVAGRWIGFY